MTDLGDLGRRLYIAAIGALGVQACLCTKVIYELEPVPPWVLGHTAVASLTGIVLVAISVGLLLKRTARVAATALAALLLLWFVGLHLPLLIPNPAPDLSFAFETLALAAMAWTLALTSSGAGVLQEFPALTVRYLRYARYALGVSLIAFFAVNLIYARFVAGMIPGWVPLHLFWTYFTGVASLAAGLSVLTGIRARLALTLLGMMYGSWVLIIHVPYLAAHPANRYMWTDFFITLGLAGGSWILAGAVSEAAQAAGLSGGKKQTAQG